MCNNFLDRKWKYWNIKKEAIKWVQLFTWESGPWDENMKSLQQKWQWQWRTKVKFWPFRHANGMVVYFLSVNELSYMTGPHIHWEQEPTGGRRCDPRPCSTQWPPRRIPTSPAGWGDTEQQTGCPPCDHVSAKPKYLQM